MTTEPPPLSAAWLARRIDISCVQAADTLPDIERLAESAVLHGFVSAHCLPNRLPQLRALLEGSPVLAGAPVGFPSGGATSAIKLAEARELLDVGAQELDFVLNIGRLRSGDIDYCVAEVSEFVQLVGGSVPTRLIIEASLLDDEQIVAACGVALTGRVDVVKTGTGWAGPTTVAMVALIARAVGDRAAIKAAGGIRTIDDIRAMSDLGVTRFGVNAAVAVELGTATHPGGIP
jgi:deoxyribose-phosphate aldolase